MGPGPAMSALPWNVLEIQILGPALNQKLSGWATAVSVLTGPPCDFDVP